MEVKNQAKKYILYIIIKAHLNININYDNFCITGKLEMWSHIHLTSVRKFNFRFSSATLNFEYSIKLYQSSWQSLKIHGARWNSTHAFLHPPRARDLIAHENKFEWIEKFPVPSRRRVERACYVRKMKFKCKSRSHSVAARCLWKFSLLIKGEFAWEYTILFREYAMKWVEVNLNAEGQSYEKKLYFMVFLK